MVACCWARNKSVADGEEAVTAERAKGELMLGEDTADEVVGEGDDTAVGEGGGGLFSTTDGALLWAARGWRMAAAGDVGLGLEGDGELVGLEAASALGRGNV